MRANRPFVTSVFLSTFSLCCAAAGADASPAAARLESGPPAPAIMRAEAHESPIVSGRSASPRRKSKLHYVREKPEPAAIEAAGVAPLR